MLQVVAENNSVSNSETEVRLAYNIMDLAISPKLTDLDEIFLIDVSQRSDGIVLETLRLA